MLSVERSSKHPHSTSDYPNPPRKRIRVDRGFASLSPDRQDIISRTALTFLFPDDDIPRAISQSDLFEPRDTFHQSTQPFEQITQPLQLQPATLWTPTSEVSNLPPALGPENLPTHGLVQTNDMYGHGSSCLPDKVFGFTRTSRQWADCFAGLVPFRQGSTDQQPFTDQYHDHSEKVDNAFSITGRPCVAGSGISPYAYQPYSDSPTSQTLISTAEMQGGQFFACDENVPRPSWQLRYPALQPMPVETRPPLTSPQNMTYCVEAPHQAENLWHHNTYTNVSGDQFYHAPEVYGIERCGTELKDEYSEAGRHAAARREIGPSRRRAFQKLEDRVQTAQTRKDKACLRCRMQKIRCLPDLSDPQGVCLTCQKVTSLTVSNLPCVRFKITEIRLFKPGQVPGLDWTDRWLDNKLTNISEWQSTKTRKILTTEGFSSSPLELEVREFVPQEGDVLERHWYIPGGIKKSVKVPCFAIADVNAAQRAYVDYINRGGAEFFKGWLQNKDQLLQRTYSVAITTANDPSTPEDEAELIKMVLRLWVAIRITTRSIRIRGEETLGMRPDILDETSPLHGEIPIPPVMGAQIELILIQGIQIPLRKSILDKLQNLIQANKQSTWFTRYLCLFILLHNCAMITKYDAGYARKYIPKRTYARPHMVEAYHDGANVLLAHWHYCNKGSKPFAPGGSAADFHAMSRLNPYQTNFVRETSTYVQANEKSWKLLQRKRAYEHDYFFVSQLYEPGWKPRFSKII